MRVPADWPPLPSGAATPLADKDALAAKVKAILQPAYKAGDIDKDDFKKASAATTTALQMAVDLRGLSQPEAEFARVLPEVVQSARSRLAPGKADLREADTHAAPQSHAAAPPISAPQSHAAAPPISLIATGPQAERLPPLAILARLIANPFSEDLLLSVPSIAGVSLSLGSLGVARATSATVLRAAGSASRARRRRGGARLSTRSERARPSTRCRSC